MPINKVKNNIFSGFVKKHKFLYVIFKLTINWTVGIAPQKILIFFF